MPEPWKLDTGIAMLTMVWPMYRWHWAGTSAPTSCTGRATQISPHDPKFWYNLACSERSFGRLIEAEAACDRAIAADVTQYPTYLLRSELRIQVPEANHIAELQSLLARTSPDPRARMFLGYALAKELDDLGRFDEAFHWFAEGARARRSRLSYDINMDESKLRRIEEVFPRDMFSTTSDFATKRQSPVNSSGYIFVLGLPRSGTTLVERILTGLPGVRSNGETEYFSRALLAAARGTGDVFQRAAAADPDAVASGYDQLARAGAGDEYIIEKLPMNYLYVGAIHRALPDAKILLLSRMPLDSCFAMYRTLFGEAYPFSYDLRSWGDITRPTIDSWLTGRRFSAIGCAGSSMRTWCKSRGVWVLSSPNIAACRGRTQPSTFRTINPCP